MLNQCESDGQKDNFNIPSILSSKAQLPCHLIRLSLYRKDASGMVIIPIGSWYSKSDRRWDAKRMVVVPPGFWCSESDHRWDARGMVVIATKVILLVPLLIIM